MVETVIVKAQPRHNHGTRHSRAIRADGKLPVIIYGHGEAPEAVSLATHEVEVALAHGARTLQVDWNGATKPYLIKEVQYDHLQKTPIHIDLARVDLNERVRVRIGIELRGTPKGVSEGGVLEQYMADLEVECLVTEIPSTLHPFVTHLVLGQELLVKDLVLPAGVIAIAEADERIAAVRVLAEAPAAAAPEEGAEATAEPERIGRIRKEEEAE